MNNLYILIINIMYSLPSHTLPSRALLLIRDYSKPCTRSEWKTSKPIITTYGLYKVLQQQEIDRLPKTPKYIALLNNIKSTEWYYAYKIINDYGQQRFYMKYIYKPGIKYDPYDDTTEAKRLYILICKL